jgi:uncharacterized membrane protein
VNLGFTAIDYLGLAFFLAAWTGYHLAAEKLGSATHGLNERMALYRRAWFEQTRLRENRIFDSTIMASLQNGAAFFASTALFAIAGVLALLQATDAALSVFADLPFGIAPTRLAYEVKVGGLGVIFVYAFFKFAWSYRLFNYTAILMGAIPVDGRSFEAEAATARATRMNIVAGRHFNRGQRAFFFALGYLGWFISAWVLIVATAAVLIVMWRRQFASDAIAALDGKDEPDHDRSEP